MNFDNDKFDLDETKKKLLADQGKYSKEQNNQSTDQEQQPVEYESVSTTLRRHEGTAYTKGTITGKSPISKAISKIEFYCDHCKDLVEIDFSPPILSKREIEKKCNRCGKFSKNSLNIVGRKNVVMIELEDTDTFDEMDRLPVYLFDQDIENIVVNETVLIKGEIEIMDNGRKMYTCVYAESIKYANRDDYTPSTEDIERIKEFARVNGIDTIDKLAEIYDHTIVGNDHVKKGLLLIAVNTSDKIENSEHLDGLLIGPPGNAKTELLERSTETVPGSSKESCEHSTGKTLTAIVEKTDNSVVLRVGAGPRAKGGICGLDEMGKLGFDDQGHFLSVMQKRSFTINKNGIHAEIACPTSIVASANPTKTDWTDPNKIDINEIPLSKQIIDRFALIFVFKNNNKSEQENDEFVDKLSDIEAKKKKGQLPDDTAFIVKYLQYAKHFNPIMTDEAIIMIREFYKKVRLQDFRSDRVFPTLHKLVKAFARLKLKEVADEADATDAMNFYNVMLSDFQKTIVISQSPKDVAYNESIKSLKEIENFGKIAFYDLIVTVCKNNKQVATWLGYEEGKSLRIDNNHKTREVRDMLLDHFNIKKVQDNPIVLQWQPDTSDTSDISSDKETKKNISTADNQNTEKNNETSSETMSDMSGMSDRNTTTGKIVDLGGKGKPHYYEYQPEQDFTAAEAVTDEEIEAEGKRIGTDMFIDDE